MDELSAQKSLLPSDGGVGIKKRSYPMEEHSAQASLLASKTLGLEKASSVLSHALRWFLKAAMLLVFIAWVAFILAYPFDSGNYLVKSWTDSTNGTFLGIEGAAFMIFSCPIILIALLSVPYLGIFRKEKLQECVRKKKPGYRLKTFPLVVEGPLGVVTAAEFIGILVFGFYIIWSVYVYTARDLSILDDYEFTSKLEEISLMLKVFGISLGLIGIFSLAFMFIPIARGSIILQLIDIPFGHAARYHIWLGHLTICIFTLHGLCYIIAWSMDGDLLTEILKWPCTEEVNTAGVITLSTGILMWLTALPPVRRKYFEVFFYTHQLYIIFVIFLALHVGVIFFCMAAGPIFLFMLDRFLRFFQSRKTVDIVSATCFPSNGIVKLIVPKSPDLQYNALSFVFVQIPVLSWLQWHPFSVSSSSLGGENHLSILIKAVGGWTTKIKQHISSLGEADSQEEMHLLPRSKMLIASVEGPYGHELPHHLMYEKLILIAGGIGISPFLAVLSDISHCFKLGKSCLVKNILLVWAVKRSDELSLLSTVEMKSICQNLSNEADLDISIYITQESEPPQEEGILVDDKSINHIFISPISKGSSMSALTGSGNNMWFGTYLLLTTLGFFILLYLMNIYYKNQGVPLGWYLGLLFVICMILSVLIFGGFAIAIWHLWRGRFSEQMNFQDVTEYNEPIDATRSTEFQYGSRPNFKDIFDSVSEHWGHVDVGVIVCGPPTLESSVARECRAKLSLRSQSFPIFHFHSHSFTL